MGPALSRALDRVGFCRSWTGRAGGRSWFVLPPLECLFVSRRGLRRAVGSDLLSQSLLSYQSARGVAVFCAGASGLVVGLLEAARSAQTTLFRVDLEALPFSGRLGLFICGDRETEPGLARARSSLAFLVGCAF